MLELLVYKIDDRRLLKILRPLLIWAIIMFVLLILVCRASETVAIISVIVMAITFVMIIPIFAVGYKKSCDYRANQLVRIKAEFNVDNGKVYLNGREVVITVYCNEDDKSVVSVKMLFDMWSGYQVHTSETEAFVNFIKENRLPFNTTGCPYPKRK